MRHLVLALSLLVGAGGCSDGYRSVGFLAPVATTLPKVNNNTASAVTLGLGDLNGDGRLDAVITDNQNQVDVLISNGDGSFATGAAYATENIGNGAPRSLVVGDLSGDGLADVVVGHVQQSTISIFWAQNDGKLVAANGNPLNVGCQPVAMALADLSRDSQTDIVIACANPNEIRLLKGRGAQKGFDAAVTLAYDLPGASGQAPPPRSIAIGQLDGDGLPDVVLGTDMDMRILLSPQEKPATYTVSAPLSNRPGGIGIGDVNGNGVSDISVVVGGLDIRVYEYAAGGTYQQAVVYQGIGVMGRTTKDGLGVADFLRDGRSDLLTMLPNPNELHLVVSRGESGPVAQPVSGINQFGMTPYVCDGCLALGDITGDGLPDVVLRNGASVNALVTAAQN